MTPIVRDFMDVSVVKKAITVKKRIFGVQKNYPDLSYIFEEKLFWGYYA